MNQWEDGMHTSEMLLAPANLREWGITYERVRDIHFTSAKKLEENLDIKIDSLGQNKAASRKVNPVVEHKLPFLCSWL